MKEDDSLQDITIITSSGVSHSDGSCVLGKIHRDESSNITNKKCITKWRIILLIYNTYLKHDFIVTVCWGRTFHTSSFNLHRNCKIFMIILHYIQCNLHTLQRSFSDEIAIMKRHYVIQPYLMIRHYVTHPTNSVILF